MKKTFLFAALSALCSLSMSAEDWAARIDGNVYLNQLSVPGTHDCATGHGFTGFMGGIAGPSSATTQSLTISAQWECGVRAFDLRPAVQSGKLEIYHGVCQTKLGFTTALTTLCDLLDAHPTEFALVLMRHETDGDSSNSSWADKVTEELSNGRISEHIVAYSPTLTLDDVRGKIVILSRDKFTSATTGFISGWSHSSDFASQKNATASSEMDSGRLYVQDFYECTGSGDDNVKREAVATMYDFSSTLCDPSSPTDIWVINHTSGYTKSASSDGNRDLAAKANAALIECLEDESRKAGPTGIVLMDFAGVDTSGKYDVKGLTLVNAIIDNNFRYTMRKAENIGPVIMEPTASNSSTIFWHSITAARRGAKVLTSESGVLLGASADQVNPEHKSQWKIEARADGKFNIVNRETGYYISPVRASFNSDIPMSATEPNAGWTFESAGNNGLYVIYSGTNVQFNQTQDAYSWHIYNWYSSFPDKSDDGCLFRFRVVDQEEIKQPDPVEPESSVYVTFEAYRQDAVVNGVPNHWGVYLQDAPEAIAGDSKFNKTSTLCGVDTISANTIWQITPGTAEGSFHVQNWATKKYLVDLIAYGSQTVTEPVNIWFPELTKDGKTGIQICTAAVPSNASGKENCLDADNCDRLVGMWANDYGNLWFKSQIDATNDEEVEAYLASIANAKKELAEKIAYIEAKIEDAKTLADLYKKSVPFAADEIDMVAASLNATTAEALLENYESKEQFDAYFQEAIITPLEETVLDAIAENTDKPWTLFQDIQNAYLSAETKSTNQGYDSFNFQAETDHNTIWTLVSAGEGQYFLKSIKDQYIGTPQVHYCQVLDQQPEAPNGVFTIGVSEGYVIFNSVAQTGCVLGFDCKNDPVEIMTFGTSPKGYLWQIAITEPYVSLTDISSVDTDNGNIYDLQGRRVVNPTKGLYIINGQKYLVK